MIKKTKIVRIGDRFIGGDYPILVQSMLKVDTKNVKEAISQIKQLEEAGCEIVRVSVKDYASAEAIKEIKKETKIPIVADIHFDPRLAIASIKNGVDKIRLNPSNIKDISWIKKIVEEAKSHDIPIRIGANLGSFTERPKDIVGALVNKVKEEVNYLESLDFSNIVLSIKSSDVKITILANEKLSKMFYYPIHLGITEAGPYDESIVKSSIGIGALLLKGIGNTIRVSITGSPVLEVKAGFEILKSLHLRSKGIEIISCPMCGRTEIDVEKIVRKVKQDFREINSPIKVAVMGCVVNGPGEAKDADIGIAGGRKMGVIFKKGVKEKVLKEKDLYSEFKKLLEELIKEKEN